MGEVRVLQLLLLGHLYALPLVLDKPQALAYRIKFAAVIIKDVKPEEEFFPVAPEYPGGAGKGDAPTCSIRRRALTMRRPHLSEASKPPSPPTFRPQPMRLLLPQ